MKRGKEKKDRRDKIMAWQKAGKVAILVGTISREPYQVFWGLGSVDGAKMVSWVLKPAA